MNISLKKTILVLIASIAAVLLLAASGYLIFINSQFSLYQDDQYKFSIKYPKSWKVIVHPQPYVAVVFLRPKDTAMDPLEENFNVTIQPLPNDLFSLSAFSSRLKKQLVGMFGKSIKIVGDSDMHWGWREGHEIVIIAPNPDHLKMVNAWVLRENQACIMTYLGDMGKFAKDGFYVNEMIRSLQLGN